MSRFFEIIELSNGDIALRHVNEQDGDALVKIHFSDDAKASLQEHSVDIARVMLEAGIRRVSELSGMEVTEEEFTELEAPRSIH